MPVLPQRTARHVLGGAAETVPRTGWLHHHLAGLIRNGKARRLLKNHSNSLEIANHSVSQARVEALTGCSKRPFSKAAARPQRGRSEVRDAKNHERHVCGRRRDGEPAVSWRRIVLILTRPSRACRNRLCTWSL